MTTTEQARELAERLKIKHGDPKPTASVLYDAATALRSLADQVERLSGTGFVFFNEDTGVEYARQHPVESGEVPDATEIRRSTDFEDAVVDQLNVAHALITALTKERDALREAAIKVAVSANELNLALDGNEAMRPLRLAVFDASNELLAALNAGGERG